MIEVLIFVSIVAAYIAILVACSGAVWLESSLLPRLFKKPIQE